MTPENEAFISLLSDAKVAASILIDITERDIRIARAGEPPWEGGPTRKELLAKLDPALVKIAEAYYAKGT